MNIFKKICSVCMPLILLTGCASIMHGTRQTIGISSYPTNAEVWVDNNYAGKSPTFVHLTRKDNHFIRLELEGYETYEAVLTHQVSGWVFGNIVFGGLPGLAIDAISGGLYQLTPDQLQIEMCKDNFAACKSDEFYIASVMTPDPSWKKIGNLVSLN